VLLLSHNLAKRRYSFANCFSVALQQE